MKKIKIIGLIVLVLVCIIIAFASCKKTKAMTSELTNIRLDLSSRDQGAYGCVVVYNMATSTTASNVDFFYIGSSSLYLNLSNNGILTFFNGGTVLERVNPTSRIFQFQIVQDPIDLYLIAYELTFTIQWQPTTQPVVSAINRTMLFRHNISNINNNLQTWTDDVLTVRPVPSAGNFTSFGLLNCSYLDYTEVTDPPTINNWVDRTMRNYLNETNLSEEAYYYGTQDGYTDGYNAGNSAGYSSGYSDGLQANDQQIYDGAYQEGYRDGEESTTAYQTGYSEGEYNGWWRGYEEAEQGATPVSKVVTLISSIMAGIGSILAIQIMPGIPLGLFILVPLFFGVVGLILWIWRRN